MCLYLLHGFNSLCGSPPAPYIYIHCIHWIHCTAWVYFTLWIPTTPMYLHSLCLLHSLHGFNSLCGSPLVPYTYIHCIHCIYCIHSLHPIHCMGSPPPVFTACTVWTPFPAWITFLHLWTLSPPPYTYIYCILHGSNSLHGVTTTNIHCVHCMDSIPCMGNLFALTSSPHHLPM